MHKKKVFVLFLPIANYLSQIPSFIKFFISYLKTRVVISSVLFENNKNILVKFFMMKRGRYNRPFLHLATLLVLTVGVIVAPFLASTYPVFSQNSSTAQIASPQTNQSI